MKVDFYQEIAQFQKKQIDFIDDFKIQDICVPINTLAESFKGIERVGKKNFLQIEEFTKEISAQLTKKDDEMLAIKREKDKLHQQIDMIVQSIILVIDQIDYLARLARPDDQWKTSLTLLYKEIEKIIGAMGLVEIPAVGEIFDENVHYCVRRVQDSNKKQYEIVDVLEKGYRFNGRVVRPALVVAVE